MEPSEGAAEPQTGPVVVGEAPAAELPPDAPAVEVGHGTPEEPAATPVAPAEPQYTNPANPDDVAAFDAETVRYIGSMTDEITELEQDHLRLKEETKKAKEAHDSAKDKLVGYIKERREQRGKPQQKNLFNVYPGIVNPTVATLESNEAADPLELLYRQFPLERFTEWGCRPGDIQRLQDGVLKNGGNNRPLMTVGDLADYSAGVGMPAGWEARLSDFRGIGPGSAQRVLDAEQGFWAWWNNRGGKEAFAAERGLTSANGPTDAGGGSEAPVEPAGAVDNAGEPGVAAGRDADSAAGEPAIRELTASELLDSMQKPDEPAVEGEGDEYSLDPDAK